MNPTRTVSELTNTTEPAWPLILDAVKEAATTVKVISVEGDRGADTLNRLQVTTRSYMGAIAFNCGGLVVDHGWLRIFGAGGEGLPSIASVNNLGEPENSPGQPGYIIVAYDVYGGVFAINGGQLVGQPGEVCYYGQDTLDWTPIGLGYQDFIEWSLGGGLEGFYQDFRWTDWKKDTEQLGLDQAFSVFPYLSTVEGQDPEKVSRAAVPVLELFGWTS